MFGNKEKQEIIRVDSVSELKENIHKTRFNSNSDFTIVGLVTSKNWYFFLQTSESLYRMKLKPGEKYNWHDLARNMETIRRDDFESICCDLRNEVIDDLLIE
jgi:hypothetical protein